MKSTLRFSFLKIISVAVFCCFVSSLAAKDLDPFRDVDYGNFHVGINVQNSFFDNYSYKTYGLHAEYPLTNHWYLDYNYDFVQTKHGIQPTHVPFASLLLALVPAVAKSGSGKAVLIMAAVAVAIPEGFSYRINPDNKFQFIPYINPFGFNTIPAVHENKLSTDHWTYSMNAGLAIEANLSDRVYVGSNTGATWTPEGGKVVVAFGLTFGMKFPDVY